MKMPQWMFIVGILCVIWCIYGKDCSSKVFHTSPTYSQVKNGRNQTLTVPTDKAPAAAVTLPPESKDDANRVIRTYADAYDVPAGLLYAVWQRAGGFTTYPHEPTTFAGADLNVEGGACDAAHGRAKCYAQYKALVAICAQVKGWGHVCNPLEARLRSSLAIGPLGLMPTDIATVDSDLASSWTVSAADGDGDGAIDPMSFIDSVAVAAKLLRSQRDGIKTVADDRTAWALVADKFAAGHPASNAGKGIMADWKKWCDMPGNCGNAVQASADR